MPSTTGKNSPPGFQPALGHHGCCTALAHRSGDLPVDWIHDLAGGKHTRDVGHHLAVDHQIALSIHVQLAGKELRIGVVTDEDEHPVGGQLPDLVALQITQPDRLHLAVPADLFHHRVQQKADLLVGKRPPLEGLPSPQLLPAVNYLHLGGETGEEKPLLDGTVAASYHQDLFVAEEETIASGAVGDAAPDELLLAGHAQPAC